MLDQKLRSELVQKYTTKIRRVGPNTPSIKKLVEQLVDELEVAMASHDSKPGASMASGCCSST